MANITVEQFRLRLREFADATAWPDTLIQMHIDDSAAEVDFSLFELRAVRGQSLWVAHHLTLDERNAQAAAGGAAGEPTRLLAGQSEGDTSESYVAPASRSAFDDFYNQTGYGQQWLAMYKFIVPGVTNTGGVVLAMPQRFRPGPFGRGR